MKKTILQLQCLFAATAVFAQTTAPNAPDWFGSSNGRVLPGGTNNPPPQAAPFLKFAPRVKVTWDDKYLYVQNNGLPDHGMMVGIMSWQQQVPLPQPYFGENAWAIPLHPVPAKNPRPIKNNFLRGAIAVGVDGIPIFNPQNNRGEISKEIGELDFWGGHCGRADDYHYHVAPLVLQNVVGKQLPIAYALDGYPIYGLAEPEGSAPVGLDECHGHQTAALGYHYHASTSYPYLNGGFHGEVVELNEQVDPQPHAQPIPPAQPPLRGARITSFTNSPDDKNFSLQYTVNGGSAAVNYTSVGRGEWKFQFSDADGKKREAIYHAGGRNGGPPPANQRGPGPENARGGVIAPVTINAKRSGNFILTSSVVTNGGALPVEFTGDGASASPPLAWSGAPAGTKYFAVVLDHFPGPGEVKWYWTLYNIPADVHGLSKNATGIGIAGNNSVNRNLGYAPPHSKGPGAKTYFITVYALRAPVEISLPPSQVNRNVLLTAMKDLVLDSAQLKFTYDRTRFIQQNGDGGPPRRDDRGRPNP